MTNKIAIITFSSDIVYENKKKYIREKWEKIEK